MSASCRVCGRQVEVSDSGQAMPCVCIRRPLDTFLADVLRDVVGPPSLEVLPPGTAECEHCGSEVRLPGFCATCHEQEQPRG